MKPVTIIDYKVANIYSISKALEYLGATIEITNDATKVARAQALVLPGVGAYEAGVKGLMQHNLIEPIAELAERSVPILGICLGAQLLLTEGHEYGTFKGLNLIRGTVEPFPNSLVSVKVPHIGWNEIEESEKGDWQNTALSSVPNNTAMYFNHSYYLKPNSDRDVLAYTTYGTFRYAAALKKGNITGVQFHPEKSAEHGLSILKNFVESI